ncbi:MAG: threonylcarbamoyl-AMP synthase [Bacteroidetes bacterium]|nr:threonylcarbamoyl-AMP synthase [Bacteroidota bacterium]MBL7105073.1 threonylcarbamoyl-AMP synthase [Bacteroidales bacterium]
MEEDIQKAVKVLMAGGTILYPTDTIWGIGCDATNNRAVQKIYKIKERLKKSSFIILLEKESKITDYVEKVPDILWDLLKSIDSPTTVIYPKAKNLTKNVIAPDGSIGIRVVKDEFCRRMISEFNKPVVSTSANFSGEASPLVFKDISEEIKNKVDYIVKTNRNKLNKIKASTIIRIKLSGEFEVLRQ